MFLILSNAKDFQGCGLCPGRAECFTSFSTPSLLILVRVLVVGIHTLVVAFPVEKEVESLRSLQKSNYNMVLIDKSLLKWLVYCFNRHMFKYKECEIIFLCVFWMLVHFPYLDNKEYIH